MRLDLLSASVRLAMFTLLAGAGSACTSDETGAGGEAAGAGSSNSGGRDTGDGGGVAATGRAGMYILVQRSCEMRQPPVGGDVSRWEVVLQGLAAWLAQDEHTDIGYGIGFFPPDPASPCTANVAEAPSKSPKELTEAIEAALVPEGPLWPTGQCESNLAAECEALSGVGKPGQAAILFSLGGDTCAGDDGALAAVTALRGVGVPSYVLAPRVGLWPELTALAAAGGTENPDSDAGYFQVTSTDAVGAALAHIARELTRRDGP